MPIGREIDERERPRHARTRPASGPEQPALSRDELAIVRRAYARQMLAILGVDNPAIEAAYAAVRREAFLGPPPWTL